MKKKYIEPRVKVYSVSTGRICNTSNDSVGIYGKQSDQYKNQTAWGKEDNEDFGW